MDDSVIIIDNRNISRVEAEESYNINNESSIDAERTNHPTEGLEVSIENDVLVSRSNLPSNSLLCQNTQVGNNFSIIMSDNDARGDVQNSSPKMPTPKHRKAREKHQKQTSKEKVVDEIEANNDDDDDQGCPICFEEWTTSGKHRLVSLKCGHLFGHKCIDRWLGSRKVCPQCNARARRMDIRFIYAGKIKAVDTSERDQVLKQLESEKKLRKKLEADAAVIRLQCQQKSEECMQLRKELDLYKMHRVNQTSSAYSLNTTSPDIGASQSPSPSEKFSFLHDIRISEVGGCRVCAYCPFMSTVIASQSSTSPVFPGYGFKKISCLDFRTSQSLVVHSKPIRDACFHPSAQDAVLLSCSTDKTLRLTNINTNNILQSYSTPAPIWSCCFNADDKNSFFAGLQNGVVLEFDIRNTTTSKREINNGGSHAPIVSLQYVPVDDQSKFRPGGLLVGQLDKIAFHEHESDEYRPHFLALSGSLTCIRFEAISRLFLASFRPTARHPRSRHIICELMSLPFLNTTDDDRYHSNICSFNTLHTIFGGQVQKLLSRTTLLAHPDNQSQVSVFASDEQKECIYIWDASAKSCVQTITGFKSPVIDMCTFSHDNTDFLLTLLDKIMSVYKLQR